jgi:hypothetical protein
MSSAYGRGRSRRANSGEMARRSRTGVTEGEDEDSCIDRAGRHSGRRRTGIHEQRLQEEPAQLVRSELKHPTSRQELTADATARPPSRSAALTPRKAARASSDPRILSRYKTVTRSCPNDAPHFSSSVFIATLFDLGIRFFQHLKDTFPLRPVELLLTGPFGRAERGPMADCPRAVCLTRSTFLRLDNKLHIASFLIKTRLCT